MKPFLLFFLLLSLFSAEPLQAAAPKVEEPVTLEEVIVTATRDAQEVRKTPANVTVITAADIEKTGATTVVEVLDRLEGIQFRTFSGNPSQAYIDMRGTGGDNPFGKTLVMLDGRRLNRTDMASINWLQTPVHMIERIEIVRGPGSVLYGDAAIGGVINIIPKKGKGRPVANASVLAGSYGLHNERIGVTGAAGSWTYALVGENNFSSGYRDRSKYAAQGGGFDVGYAAHDLLNVSLGVSFNRTDYQMPGALTKDQMRQDRRQYQPAMPAYFMNANDNNDGRDKYTNVNLGVKSFPNLPPQEPAKQKSAPASRAHRTATADEVVEPAPRYLPGFAPQGLDALELEGLAPDLQRELQEVRLVMYRLLRLWDDAEPPLPPEEARRLAALVFSGARTVAHLLNQQAGSGDARGWLKGALDQVAAEYGIDL